MTFKTNGTDVGLTAITHCGAYFYIHHKLKSGTSYNYKFKLFLIWVRQKQQVCFLLVHICNSLLNFHWWEVKECFIIFIVFVIKSEHFPRTFWGFGFRDERFLTKNLLDWQLQLYRNGKTQVMFRFSQAQQCFFLACIMLWDIVGQHKTSDFYCSARKYTAVRN